MATGVKRYHPALVALHWLLALAITGNLVAGKFILEGMANSDPAKPEFLRLHMASGLVILLLMVTRLLLRWRTAKPPVPNAGALKWLAVGNHWALYAVTFAMLMTGPVPHPPGPARRPARQFRRDPALCRPHPVFIGAAGADRPPHRRRRLAPDQARKRPPPHVVRRKITPSPEGARGAIFTPATTPAPTATPPPAG
jgi:hypothetical protein